jgi:predicted secreted protein
MKFTSILAIYSLFWSMSFFFVLPFRLRSDDLQDVAVAGQAESAPPRFSFARTCLWTSIVAAVLFAIFYANWAYGWVGADVMDFLWEGADRR